MDIYYHYTDICLRVDGMGIMELPKQELLLAEYEFVNTLKKFPKEERVITAKNEKTVNNLSEPANKLPEDFLPEQGYEKEIDEARKILGKKATKFTREQLKDTVIEIKYLVSTWLDEVERELFDGQTLNELLHDKEGK
jgi:hypothetical protein